MSLRVKKYNMSIIDKDLKSSDTNSTEDTVELEKLSTYMICPLDFGGFLAIDSDNISVYKKKLRTKLLTKQLRKVMQVKAIIAIDEFDPYTNLTKEGKPFFRYLFGTRSGELYLIHFDLALLPAQLNDQKVQPFNANKFMNVEYLGGRLSNCSSLAYVDNGYIYYGSRDGDSYLLKLESEITRVKDQPYFSIVRTYANIGMIYDLQMKHKSTALASGHQNELIVASGRGDNAGISVLKKGVSICSLSRISDLPPLDEINGITTVKDRVFLKFLGLPQIVALDCA